MTAYDATAAQERQLSGLGLRVAVTVNRWAPELLQLSHSLHREPELGFEEHRSSEKVANLLQRTGFDVDRCAGGLPTALAARAGSGRLTIAMCAEYDALPGIGHACGHNVNGAAAVGAAIGLACVADELDLTVKLVGTPGEETLGGKVFLLEAGVFDDVAAAMMVHAAAEDEVGLSSFALSMWEVEYAGVAAHAATAPWSGVNALDAVSLAYQAVGLLRQQLPPGVVVSFVVVDGGQAPNVIPDRARARVELRATSSEQLHELQERVRACLEAGALATGANLCVVASGNEFADLRQDDFMTAAYVRAATTLGRTPLDGRGAPRASTDMGNVSHQLPVIHPMIGYDVDGAAHHTVEFAAHGTTPSADTAVLHGSIALALVGVAVAGDAEQRTRLLRLLKARSTQQEP